MEKTTLKYGLGLILLFVLVYASLFIGVSNIALNPFSRPDSQGLEVLFAVRLPRTISIIIAGASLSLSGLLAQHITQNRFASPETMGTFAAGRLGLILSIFLFPGSAILSRSMFSFLFSLLGTFLFIKILDTIRLKNSMLVPVIGIIFGNIIQALGSYIAIDQDISQEVNAWFQGSFSSLHSQNFQLILVSLLALVFIILGSHYFAVLGLGRDIATDLGVPFERIRLISIALIALASSAVLLTVGNIPFVGIVIPNLVAFFQGDHFQKNMGAVLLLGPIFLLFCDILARLLIAPYEIPVSIIVGVIGAGIFIFILLRGEHA